MPDKSTTCYFYHSNNGYNLTVAYKREHADMNGDSNVVYGAAFCHPSDQFNKKIGRDIAEDRMNDGDSTIHMPYDSKRYQVHEAIIESLSTLPWTPDYY